MTIFQGGSPLAATGEQSAPPDDLPPDPKQLSAASFQAVQLDRIEERLNRIEAGMDILGQHSNWIVDTLGAMSTAVMGVMQQFQGKSPLAMMKAVMGGNQNGRPNPE